LESHREKDAVSVSIRDVFPYFTQSVAGILWENQLFWISEGWLNIQHEIQAHNFALTGFIKDNSDLSIRRIHF
jgi:hypothetical protein